MKILIISTLLLFSCTALANSYDDDLKELFELTGVRNNYIGLNNSIINQMQSSFFQAADQSIDAKSFTEDQKKQAGEILKARFTVMVKNYEEHVKESMPYETVAQDIYLPLYKENYTESEVKELIVFYRSPVGKKTIGAAQKISQQASQRSAEKYDSIIIDFVKKQIEDNITLAQKEIADQVAL
jgi:hypothetical protein